MLRNIPEIISPKLMKTLMEMGHGEDICFCDANFPVSGMAKRIVRADGLRIADLLEAILPFFPLDTFIEMPVTLMEAPKDERPSVWKEYEEVIRRNDFSGARGLLKYNIAKGRYL